VLVEPDVGVPRGSDSDLYVDVKNVEGDLTGGLKVKDKVVEADGSCNGISGDYECVVEISAQGQITDDFNPTTTETETARESFKGLIEANKENPGELPVEKLPVSVSGFDNPDMTVRVIDNEGNLMTGGEFTIRDLYEEVHDGN
jgi:hypothetical protein